MSVSVLIVSYRTPDLTVRAIGSALEAVPDGEIVVVDNDSGDSSVERIRASASERVRLEVNDSNLGYGQAANTAAARSSGDVLIFLNSDALLGRSAAELLVREVEASGGRCLAGPRLVHPDGSVQRSAGLLPGPLDLTVRAWGLNRLGAAMAAWPVAGPLVRRSRLSREYDSAPRATKPFDTSMVSGACCAIGRNAFDELGGFDEAYFLYFEDADICRRARHAGMALRYVPAAVVSHVGGASSHDDYHLGPHHARSMRLYLGKWYGPAGSALALVVLWVRAAGMTLSLQRGARRAWRAWWAAFGDEDPRR